MCISYVIFILQVSLDEMSNSIEISRAVLFGRTLPDVFEENEALNHKVGFYLYFVKN